MFNRDSNPRLRTDCIREFSADLVGNIKEYARNIPAFVTWCSNAVTTGKGVIPANLIASCCCPPTQSAEMKRVNCQSGRECVT